MPAYEEMLIDKDIVTEKPYIKAQWFGGRSSY
jgi:hypothetical protein